MNAAPAMRTYLTHPLTVRIWHWANAIIVFIMLWSGFAMFASERRFSHIAHAIPASFWGALQMRSDATLGRAWHLGFALLFIANMVCFIANAIRTGTWRGVVPNTRSWLRDAVSDTLADIRSASSVRGQTEYNGAQRLAYSGAMFMLIVMLITGPALWLKHRFPWLIGSLGGENIVLPAHVVVATLLLAYIFVHVVQVARAGGPTMLAMVSGTTEVRPARTRWALVASTAVLIAAFAGFAVLRSTSGPTGVPTYLQWTVEHKSKTTK